MISIEGALSAPRGREKLCVRAQIQRELCPGMGKTGDAVDGPCSESAQAHLLLRGDGFGLDGIALGCGGGSSCGLDLLLEPSNLPVQHQRA